MRKQCLTHTRTYTHTHLTASPGPRCCSPPALLPVACHKPVLEPGHVLCTARAGRRVHEGIHGETAGVQRCSQQGICGCRQIHAHTHMHINCTHMLQNQGIIMPARLSKKSWVLEACQLLLCWFECGLLVHVDFHGTFFLYACVCALWRVELMKSKIGKEDAAIGVCVCVLRSYR